MHGVLEAHTGLRAGGIYLEVRIVLVSLAKSMAQMKKKHGLAVVNTPKSDFSIILHVHGVRVLNGPKGPEPLIEVCACLWGCSTPWRLACCCAFSQTHHSHYAGIHGIGTSGMRLW